MTSHTAVDMPSMSSQHSTVQTVHQSGRVDGYADDAAASLSSSSSSLRRQVINDSKDLLRRSYRRFYFWHVLALLPTLVVILSALAASLYVRQFCHLQNRDPAAVAHPGSRGAHARHSSYERGRCRDILDVQLLLSTLALGLVGWLASYTSRKACFALADKLIPRLFRFTISPFSRPSSGQNVPTTRSAQFLTGSKEGVIVTVSVAMQALIAESLRVLSFFWACCILVTALYLYPKQDAHTSATASRLFPSLAAADTEPHFPDWAWRLSFRDPRFFVATWSSIAWALAEFGFGAFQILHQVSLYRPSITDDIATGALPDLSADYSGGIRGDERHGQSGFSLLSVGRANGKAKRATASQALEQARQRLLEPSNPANVPNYGSTVSQTNATVSTQRLQGQTAGDYENDDDDDNDDDEDRLVQEAEHSDFASSTSISLLDQELEEEVERFLVAKERAEVEAVLGVPLPEIPVALCALWRLDAMLWSVGSSLLLSSSFTHAQGSLGHLSHSRFDLSDHFVLFPEFVNFSATFICLVVLHTIVSSLWATSLPNLGFATTTYASLLFGLGIMIAALARWGLLI
ncbi:hypothetical protein BCV70DRAFT_198411 [Testicularia cyperi]|uniref:Uncharacterized protein n=1 Tax=Testicularia cyperi TaxID=1882483 RepID=A0A317XV20_9BASI|nr:hypothetical protein BCV70DRAFT_198411 [Testicularia cyperi]